MGPEMGMGMGMGMGSMVAPALLDIGPVWSPSGDFVVFSRVTGVFQSNNWTAASLSGGMGMGMGMGMGPGMGPEMGMGMPGMGMGMGSAGADLASEGLMTAPAAGGSQGDRLIEGRVLVQDAAGDTIVVIYQGSGFRDAGQWGISGVSFGSSSPVKWVAVSNEWTPAWVSLSPKADTIAVPWERNGKFVVFFPAQGDVQAPAGSCAVGDLKQPAGWAADGSGVFVLEATQVPGMGMGMGMGPEMGGMGPGMGPGMGMGMGAMGSKLSLGKPDGSLTQIIENVGNESFAVGLPGTSDLAAWLNPASGAPGTSEVSWPGAQLGIFIYALDGTQKAKLTSQKVVEMKPSPDGKYVGFVWGKQAPYSLAVAPVDGGSVKRLAFDLVGRLSGVPCFSWSPDSKKIAYGAHSEDEPSGIFAVDIATGARTRLSSAPELQTNQPGR